MSELFNNDAALPTTFYQISNSVSIEMINLEKPELQVPATVSKKQSRAFRKSAER